MTRYVIGLFETREAAEAGVRALLQAGFSRDKMGLALLDRKQEQVVASELGAHPPHEEAAKTAAKWGALGGLGGLVAGVAALAIPGIGPVIAVGPLGVALTALVTGATGALGGALTALPTLDA